MTKVVFKFLGDAKVMYERFRKEKLSPRACSADEAIKNISWQVAWEFRFELHPVDRRLRFINTNLKMDFPPFDGGKFDVQTDYNEETKNITVEIRYEKDTSTRRKTLKYNRGEPA